MPLLSSNSPGIGKSIIGGTIPGATTNKTKENLLECLVVWETAWCCQHLWWHCHRCHRFPGQVPLDMVMYNCCSWSSPWSLCSSGQVQKDEWFSLPQCHLISNCMGTLVLVSDWLCTRFMSLALHLWGCYDDVIQWAYCNPREHVGYVTMVTRNG